MVAVKRPRLGLAVASVVHRLPFCCSMKTMTPLPAAKALDTAFLEIRSKLLDLAAALDRVGRGHGAAAAENDPRLDKIRQALEILEDRTAARAERIQRIFSDEYDKSWKVPQPR